jgi:hypothetical protein
MNKILIGLLIMGAAAGAFFYLRNKDKQSDSTFNKEWIVGEWKIDSISTVSNDSLHDLVKTGILPDSNYRQYQYSFFNDGRIVKAGSDSAHTYTLQYDWQKEKEKTLTWKKTATDSTGVSLQVSTLAKDTMVLESADKGMVRFIKAR